MIEGCEELVEAVRRRGPGVLPLSDLSGELNIRTQTGRWNTNRVRRAVRASKDRLRMVDLHVDSQSPLNPPEPLGSWVLVASTEDAPDQSWIVRAMWEGLNTLAKEIDPRSRVRVSRWILKASEANALFTQLHERSPPPTSPHPSLLT